ncbi:MAG TPA: SBBP repeat-containing protein [Terriglobia bacterium]
MELDLRGFWVKMSVLACLATLTGLLDSESSAAAVAKSGQASSASPVGLQNAKSAYGVLPLSFEPNQGQTDRQVRFLSRGPGYSLFLTADEAVLALKAGTRIQGSPVGGHSQPEPDARQQTTDILRMKLIGSNPKAMIVGSDEQPGKSNYFIGNDAKKWFTGVPNYARVKFAEVYSGVDLVYYGNQGHLEYDFVVAPGADPRAITLDVGAALAPGGKAQSRGGERQAVPLQIAANGDLILETEDGRIRFQKPTVYQPVPGGEKRYVDAGYVLGSGHSGVEDQKSRVRFELGSYDHGLPLIIDPVLVYSTYLGGNGGDTGYGIAVDSSGDAYVTGSTASLNFPVKSAAEASPNGQGDAFVSKLNAAGSGLIYSTYVGGSGSDVGSAIAIDASGNAYIAGSTSSPNFPVTSGVFQSTYGGGTDAFIVKLDASGSALSYASYLGGSAADFAQGVAVDSSGDVYVTGSTQSPDFPVANAFQIGNNNCTVVDAVTTCSADAFVAKVDPAGTTLVYSTYLGGSSADSGQAIAVDAQGNAYIAGYTYSSNFPVQNPLQSSGGGIDAFVTELNARGSGLVFSTYLGGSGTDQAFGLTLDGLGYIYVTGQTQSADFPTTPGVFQTLYGGNGDAFMTKLAARGTALVYSTFIGGSSMEQGNGVAVDSAGNTVVVGVTTSSNFPTVDPSQRILGISGAAGTCSSSVGTSTVCSDAFVTRLKPSGTASYSTYLGGTGADFAQAVAVDSSGVPYVAGATASSNFPTIVGALQGAYAGAGTFNNVFVAKIDLDDAPGVALSPQNVNFGNQTLNVTSTAQSITLINAGSAPLQITDITASGDYAESNTCGTVVPAGSGTCTISITYTPVTAGPSTDQIIITDTAAGSPHTITVTGNGVLGGGGTLTLTPKSLTFPVQAIGVTSAPQIIQVVNGSQAAVTITAIAVTGDFAETNTCGSGSTGTGVLNPGASCAVSITFTATASGSRTGSLSITDNAANSPQSASLSGSGGGLFTLSASSLTSSIVVGATSTTFTLSASAPSSFTSSISFSCSSSATCSFNPATITAGQSTMLTVSGLSVTTANPLNITVTGTSGTNTATLSLTIFLQDFSVTATPSLFSLNAGASATYTVTVSAINGFNGVVLLNCSSALPNLTTCTWSPSSGASLHGSSTILATLTVATTTQQTSHGWWRRYSLPNPPGGDTAPGRLWVVVAGIVALLAALLAARRKPCQIRSRWTLVVVGILLLTLTGASCNNYGYNVVGPPVIVGTPTGIYVIQISGTLGTNSSVIRSTTVNLNVSPG